MRGRKQAVNATVVLPEQLGAPPQRALLSLPGVSTGEKYLTLIKFFLYSLSSPLSPPNKLLAPSPVLGSTSAMAQSALYSD